MSSIRETHRLISKCYLQFISKCLFLQTENPSLGRREILSPSNDQTNNRNPRHKSTSEWPALYLGVYIYSSIKILVYLYFQYIYDIEYLRQCQLDQSSDPFLRLVSSNKEISRNSTVYLSQKIRTEDSRAILKLIGAPYPEMHFVCVGAGFLLVSISFAVYGSYLLLVKLGLIQPFDLYFLRVMLNEAAEIERCRQMTKSIVDRWKAMSELKVFSFQMNRTLEGISQHTLRPISLRCSTTHSIQKQFAIHIYLCQQADLMVKGNHLMPINRSQSWVDWKSLVFASIALSVTVHFTIFDSIFIYIVPYALGYLEINSLMDVWLLFDVFLLMAQTIIGPANFLALLVSNCFDQKGYMMEITSRYRNCINENEEMFANYEKTKTKKRLGDKTDRESIRLSKLLNGNLMRTLLEFEIFASQFEPTRKSFPFVVNTMIVTLISVSGLSRLFMPYISTTIHTLAIYFSLTALILCDLVLMPICQIHQTVTKLYRAMWSLMVQTVALNTEMVDLEGCSLFSEHLCSIQRKLLEDNHQFTRRFATYGLNGALEISWLGLLQFHIVFSLLLVSGFQAKSWKTLAGERANDPLGIFASNY